MLKIIDKIQDSRIKRTKARPIQMNPEMKQICRQEIKDLENKGLIRKSKSTWNCSAFYVI